MAPGAPSADPATDDPATDDAPSGRPARGAMLPVWATIGTAPTAAVGPHRRRSSGTARGIVGNGFDTRFADDLALLADHGITHVRVTFDWSRVQPRAGAIDGDAVEWHRNVVQAARSLGLSVWITLLERDVPRWFDDERGFADVKTAARWWPRWVEVAADAIGDLADGWHPIDHPLGVATRLAQRSDDSLDPVRHGEVIDTLVVAWRDAWRVLRGGPPVATALRVGHVHPADDTVPALQEARRLEHLMWTTWLRGLRDGSVMIPGRADRELADLAGAADVMGVAVALSRRDLPQGRVTDEALAQLSDRIGHHLRRAAEMGPDRPMQVSSARFAARDLSDRGHLLGAVVTAVDDARRDGVPIEVAFAEPAIDALPASADVAQSGLFTRDREPTPALERWLA